MDGVKGVLLYSVLNNFRPPQRRSRKSKQPVIAALKRCATQIVSDSEVDQRRTAAAFVLRCFFHRLDVRVLLQELTQSLAQNTHAAAVHDADTRQPGEESAVYESFDVAGGVVDGLADDVDLAGNIRVFSFERD